MNALRTINEHIHENHKLQITLIVNQPFLPTVKREQNSCGFLFIHEGRSHWAWKGKGTSIELHCYNMELQFTTNTCFNIYTD